MAVTCAEHNDIVLWGDLLHVGGGREADSNEASRNARRREVCVSLEREVGLGCELRSRQLRGAVFVVGLSSAGMGMTVLGVCEPGWRIADWAAVCSPLTVIPHHHMVSLCWSLLELGTRRCCIRL